MLRAAVAAMVTLSCASKGGGEPAANARVVIETAGGARHAVGVEVARTDAQRARGLMHRAALPDDRGMLFLFDESEDHPFWMKDTPLSLDIIFLDEEGRIVGIVERAAPRTTTARSVGVPSRFVLEVNGGWARARGVRTGDRARFEGVDRF